MEYLQKEKIRVLKYFVVGKTQNLLLLVKPRFFYIHGFANVLISSLFTSKVLSTPCRVTLPPPPQKKTQQQNQKNQNRNIVKHDLIGTETTQI